MKILILANYADGLYLFRKEVVQAMMDAGHEVLVSVPLDENCKKLQDMGLEIIETPLERRGMNPFRDLKLFFTYISMIKEVKPQVILTYTIKPNIYGAMAARFLHVPYICNVTGLGLAVERGGMLSKILLSLYRFSTGKARKVFFQNKSNMEFMQSNGVARNNAGLLPGSGVNLSQHPYREYPSEQEGIRFLSVCRIMKAKGIDELAEAIRNVKPRHDNIIFEIAGEYEADQREHFEPIIKELESKGMLRHLGYLNGTEAAMAKSHVILHPTYSEGISNVLLEAASCGRPVLASHIPGCVEAIDPGNSGITFEVKNAKAIEEAIEKILSFSEEERREMGVKGRKWVEDRFDRQIVIDAYMQELSRL